MKKRYIYDRVPRWFVAGLKRAYPCQQRWKWASDLPGGQAEVAVMLLYDLNNGGWLDHTGWVGMGNKAVLVSEPYGFGTGYQNDATKVMRRLIEFVEKCGFKLNVHGGGEYHPRTLRIEITPNLQ